LAVAAAEAESPTVARMGKNLADQRFFRVVKGNVAGRFLQFSTGSEGTTLGVVELVLGGRSGAEGLFPQDQHGEVMHLDLLKTLKQLGTKAFFGSFLVWAETQHSMLHLSLPSGGNLSSQMRSLRMLGDVENASYLPARSLVTREWDTVVANILQLQRHNNMSDQEGCYFDIVESCLRSQDSMHNTEVQAEMVLDLITSGVLKSTETEFGELLVSVNHQAVQWCHAAGLERGIIDIAGNIDLSAPRSKLALMARLVSTGWRASALGDIGEYYAEGVDKVFELSTSRSKSYYAVMVLCDKILPRMAIDDSVLPAVYHGMTESYYKLLLRLRSRGDALALQALLDGAGQRRHLRDEHFAKLLPSSESKQAQQHFAVDGIPENLPALLDRPVDDSRAAQDIARVHRMAAQVLRARPSEMVDLRSTMRCADGLSRIDVHLDNCSHSSGKQRAYVACPVKWHSACYKYSIVERFENLAHVSAWLTAWGRYAATRSPSDFPKNCTRPTSHPKRSGGHWCPGCKRHRTSVPHEEHHFPCRPP